MALWATTELLLHSTQAAVTVPKATITHTDSRHTQQDDESKPWGKATEGVKVKVCLQLNAICAYVAIICLHMGEKQSQHIWKTPLILLCTIPQIIGNIKKKKKKTLSKIRIFYIYVKGNAHKTASGYKNDCRQSGGNITSEMLTRPSWKEQSLAFWVHMWRYLHQWQGKEPFTQERQLK